MGHKIYLMLESLFIIVAIFVNRYSHKRMGLNRHFIFEQYRLEIWAADKPFILIMAGLIFILLRAAFLIWRGKKALKLWGKFHLFFIGGLVLSLLYLSFFPGGREIMIAPYLYIALPLLSLGNLIGLAFSGKN